MLTLLITLLAACTSLDTCYDDGWDDCKAGRPSDPYGRRACEDEYEDGYQQCKHGDGGWDTGWGDTGWYY